MTIEKWVITLFIGFVAGIIAGRTSTSYRLYMAQALAHEAGKLLDETARIKKETEVLYDKFESEGCFLREDGRP